MKLLSSLILLMLFGLSFAEDETVEAKEKIDQSPELTSPSDQVQPPANKRQFPQPQPQFVRESPRFNPRPEFQDRPNFQSGRQAPDDFPFRQPEFVRRPVLIREPPPFEDPRFSFEPGFRQMRPQQVRSIEPIKPDVMFSDPHAFTLPASQFMPLRVHHSSTSSQPQTPKPEKSPQKPQSFPTTFFNMPFSSVAMTPFKVSTAVEEGQTKPSEAQGTETSKPTSEFVRLVPQERPILLRRPFFQPELEFSSSMMSRPSVQEFGGLRTADEIPPQEFLEPLPPVRRPISLAQFEHPRGTAFEFRPDMMSFGPPLAFQVATGDVSSLKTAQQEESQPNKGKLTDQPKKSVEENLKSTDAVSSGLKFRPFGVAPIQFQNTGSVGIDSLRSAAAFVTQEDENQRGRTPIRPIILRPVKLLSPSGADITKSASTTENEFKAFMTVSEEDLQPMASTKTRDDEPLKGRNVQTSESETSVRETPRPRQLIRVRPRDDDHVTKHFAGSAQHLRFRASPSHLQSRSKLHLKQPTSTSFVEYRLQPSYIQKSIRTLAKSPANARAEARIYYEPQYFERKAFDYDRFANEKETVNSESI